MSSTQMRNPIMGANGWQPCEFVAIPSHKSRSDLHPFYEPQSPGYRRHDQAIAATTTPKDEISRAPRCHDPSCNRPTQKYHMQSLHMVPQTDVSRHGTLTRLDQQKFCLQRGVNDASGPKRPQGPYKFHHQKAHGDAGSSKPCGKDDLEGRTRAHPGQGTAVAVVSLGAVNTQPPRAPPMRPIPLPLPKRQKGDEYIYNGYGRKMAPGSVLMGTVQADNFPKVLSPLVDMGLPVPFAY